MHVVSREWHEIHISNLLIANIWILKTTYSQKNKNSIKKSQPVSLLADSKVILIKITSKWGYTIKKIEKLIFF